MRPRKNTLEQRFQLLKAKQQKATAVKASKADPSNHATFHLNEAQQDFSCADTFFDKRWNNKEAAEHLGLSAGTLKRLTLMELADGSIDIGTMRIGPKKAQTHYTFTESALRRIHNRLMGGYYGRPLAVAS